MNFARPDAQHETRVAEILDSVKPVLVAKGFDNASMQDLARAAGMSAGNFYRYFPSKDDLILAMVDRDLDVAIQEFDAAMEAMGPLAAFRRVLQSRIERKAECSVRMWSAIEASCQSRPGLAEVLQRTERSIRTRILTVFASIAGVSEEESVRRFDGHARFLMMLMHGLGNSAHAARQAGDPPEAVQQLRRLTERSMDNLLADVAAGGPIGGEVA